MDNRRDQQSRSRLWWLFEVEREASLLRENTRDRRRRCRAKRREYRDARVDAVEEGTVGVTTILIYEVKRTSKIILDTMRNTLSSFSSAADR
jgi:gluconate kinase